jgi:hypothetical protein
MNRWPTGYEADPLARFFVGRRADIRREAVFGSLEVLGVSAIPNKKVRRIAQGALIGVHVFCGIHNLKAR